MWISVCFLSDRPPVFCAFTWANDLDSSSIFFQSDLCCVFLEVPVYATEHTLHSLETEAPYVFGAPKCLDMEHAGQLLSRVSPTCFLQSDRGSPFSVVDSPFILIGFDQHT